MKKITGIFLILLSSFASFGQDSLTTNIAADIYSRYVWRGLDYGSSPSIQPTLSIAKKNIELGYWGAISTLGTYNEIDLYLKYSLKGFYIVATDYYFPVNAIPSNKTERYFNFEDKTTGHIVEGMLGWKGSEKFPLTVFVGTSFYGADKDTSGDNRYSTYTEASYTFKIKNTTLDVFMGFTPTEGLYGNDIGIVNLGFTGTKKIKINSDFEIPAKVSLVINPQTEGIHLAFGISL